MFSLVQIIAGLCGYSRGKAPDSVCFILRPQIVLEITWLIFNISASVSTVTAIALDADTSYGNRSADDSGGYVSPLAAWVQCVANIVAIVIIMPLVTLWGRTAISIPSAEFFKRIWCILWKGRGSI